MNDPGGLTATWAAPKGGRKAASVEMTRYIQKQVKSRTLCKKEKGKDCGALKGEAWRNKFSV